MVSEIAPQSIAAASNAVSAWLKIPPGANESNARPLSGDLGGGTITLSAEQATSAAGANAKVLGAAALLTTSTNASGGAVELSDALDIQNGFYWFQFKLANVGGTGALAACEIEAGPAIRLD